MREKIAETISDRIAMTICELTPCKEECLTGEGAYCSKVVVLTEELEALFTAEQKQWEEDLIDYLNYRLSEYTKKEHLFETIKKWRD